MFAVCNKQVLINVTHKGICRKTDSRVERSPFASSGSARVTTRPDHYERVNIPIGLSHPFSWVSVVGRRRIRLSRKFIRKVDYGVTIPTGRNVVSRGPAWVPAVEFRRSTAESGSSRSRANTSTVAPNFFTRSSSVICSDVELCIDLLGCFTFNLVPKLVVTTDSRPLRFPHKAVPHNTEIEMRIKASIVTLPARRRFEKASRGIHISELESWQAVLFLRSVRSQVKCDQLEVLE
ncbi:hypothetical protein EVAR_53454_1 [Eumeta japonica]|uniref:Uncharacterized protein n=1 Tax=Eumeta variegata TaxID=151549 RepID=A0A4C1XTZ8_EUMVA|nr:hypothetical protein EVAR_53454_1 [Eumeta japonica]